ncbi:hypothetical protein [Nitratireductor rhodophyticola]|uniref:hypothetical protein n=1 Tax=Nitratireductor rhodophyticola TaxID=2854036 RepID=UPI00300BE22A
MTTRIGFDLLRAHARASDIVQGTAQDKLISVDQMRTLSQMHGAKEIDIYSSSSALLSSIPINTGQRYVVYSVGPIALSSDDLIIAMSECYFSHGEPTNIGVWSQLLVMNDLSTPVSNGEITEAKGRNITQHMARDTHMRAGMLRSPSNQNLLINYRAHGGSTATSEPVTVRAGGGRLDVAVIRNFFEPA